MSQLKRAVFELSNGDTVAVVHDAQTDTEIEMAFSGWLMRNQRNPTSLSFAKYLRGKGIYTAYTDYEFEDIYGKNPEELEIKQ